MVTRRDFIRSSALAAGAAATSSNLSAAPSRMPQPFFGLHPFIEANPKAVFIRRTNVPDKMHEESEAPRRLDSSRARSSSRNSRTGSGNAPDRSEAERMQRAEPSTVRMSRTGAPAPTRSFMKAW